MESKPGRQDVGNQTLFRLLEHSTPLNNAAADTQFPFSAALQLGQRSTHISGSLGIAPQRSDALPAAVPEPEFVNAPIFSGFLRNEALARNRLEFVCIQLQ